ncbi:MAG: alkaline phosphatase family protein [archaeon GB-1867-005]|nr:alkaline phosphatase family protein [Candidatus Culexmicrobium cathedralense]
MPKIIETDELLPSERRIFREVDKLIKSLRETHENLVIVSDHGYATYNKLISVNDILIKHKLANATKINKISEISDYKKPKRHAKPKSTKIIDVNPKIYSLIRKLHLSRITRSTLNIISTIVGRKIRVKTSRWVRGV